MPLVGLRLPEQYGSKLPAIRYSLAVALTAVAFLWRQEMVRQFGSELPPFITFYPTVMIVAILAGFWPGLLATLLAAAAAIYWILPPHEGFAVSESRDVFGLAVFAVMGVFMSLVAGLYRRAREKSSAYEKEMALRETHEFNRQIIASTREGIIVLDRQLRCQIWNPFMEKGTGIRASQLLGKQPWEVLPEYPELKELIDGLQWALGGEEVSLPDLPIELPRGSRRSWFSVSTNPLRNLQGEVIGVLAFLHDITERRHAEHHLRQSQASLSRAQSVAHIGSWYLDCTSNDLKWSDETYRIFKIALGTALTYEAFLERVHPEDREQVDSAWKTGLLTGSYRIEHRIIAGGETRWVSEKAEIEFGSGGQPQSAVGTVQDITQRKQAEEKLLLQITALRAAANAVVITDPAGNIQWANPAFERLTGYSADEFMGKNPRLLRSGVHDRAFYKNMWDTILAGRTWEGEITNRRKDGSLYTQHQTITPVQDASGVITEFIAIQEDVTEQYRAEEALRKSEEMFSKAFRTSPLGFGISTEAEGRYLDVNDTFLQMLGYKRNEVIGRTTRELNIWADPEEREALLRRLRQSERVTGLRIRYNTARGETRDAELAAERIELDGQPCILSISQDVTEARRLEAQLRQAQKMEAIGRLSGGIAHDFNNLLGIMMGYAELSCSLTDPAHPAARNLAEIRKAGQRAIALTRQLLAFSRQQVVFPRILDLNAVVNDVAKMLSRVIGEDITLTLRLADSLASIRADESQIEQILMNLAINARDAMPKGGKLIIETANVQLDDSSMKRHLEVRPGPYVLLSVSDTGSGMEKDTLAHIFEPFFTTKGTGKGTGLGLSTVYGIVKQSQGFVWVYSEPGKGTTFRIYLPSVKEAVTVLPQLQPEAVQAAGQGTILLVEDDEAFRQLTASVLRSAGYTVIETEDAAAALKQLEEWAQPIHLLLTDVIMPGMAGSDLARRAQQLHPDLRVLFMSGYTGDLLSQYGSIGQEQVVEKPFTRASLLAKVEAILHPSNALAPVTRP